MTNWMSKKHTPFGVCFFVSNLIIFIEIQLQWVETAKKLCYNVG